MSSETLEKCYDVILTGNNMTSSLVAAAASRVGKKVLLVDCFDKGPRRFPREWSSIKLFELVCSEVLLNQTGDTFKNAGQDNTTNSSLKCHPSWTLSNAKIYHCNMFENKDKLREFLTKNMRIHNKIDEFVERFTQYYYPSLKSAKNPNEADKFLTELREEFPYYNSFSNNFTLDLTPRILQANGSLTDLLIKSNITRYLTFQKVARLLTFVKQNDGSHQLINVPCTRSDVFKSSQISLKEKRLLMKLLQYINEFDKTPEKFEQFENIPFGEFVEDFFRKQSQEMPDIIVEILLNAVLMCDKTLKTGDALRRFTRFMNAIGRFTDRPYLVSDYGTDDIVQAFCRYSSVYGGVYCLDTKMNSAEKDSENGQVKAVTLEGHGRLECSYLVSNYKFPDLKESTSNKKSIMSRAITCSRASILQYADNECYLSFLYVPESITGTVPVYVYETNVATHACTIGLHVQYYWCNIDDQRTAESIIKPVIEKLFNNDLQTSIDNDQLLWCLFYNQDCIKSEYESMPNNLFIVSPPLNEIDYDSVVGEAKEIFLKMFPDEEFFPQTKEPTGNDDDDEKDDVVMDEVQTEDSVPQEHA